MYDDKALNIFLLRNRFSSRKRKKKLACPL